MNEKYELLFLATLVVSLVLCNAFCYYCNNDKDRLECFDEVSRWILHFAAFRVRPFTSKLILHFRQRFQVHKRDPPDLINALV